MASQQGSLTVRDYLFSQAPSKFLEDVMKGLVQCYTTANKIVSEDLSGRFGAEARPHIQRALVDAMLVFEAGKHAKVARGEVVENSAGSSVHAEVYCGNITLTAHHIQTPTSGVRRGRYREELADHPDQGNLFGEATVTAETRLYGMILHGCNGRDKAENGKVKERNRPDFVLARFPLPGCVEFSVAVVDMIAEFPEVFGQSRSQDPAGNVEDNVSPKLKRQEGTGDAG